MRAVTILETYARGDLISDKDLKWFLDTYNLDFTTALLGLGPAYDLVATNLIRICIQMRQWQEARKEK